MTAKATVASAAALALAGGVFMWSLLPRSPKEPGSDGNPKADQAAFSKDPEDAAPPPVELQTDPVEDHSSPLKQATAWKEEAVAAAREVAEAYPDTALSYALLGSAYFNIGQTDEAAANLRRCLELDPGQTEAYEILARIAYDKGELEKAARRCREGIQNAGPNPVLLNRLGRVLIDLGQPEEAVGALEKRLSLPGVEGETHYLLGQARLQSGQLTEARKYFRKAIELRPDHTQAHFGLFTACARLGDSEAAKRARERFLELEKTDRRSLTERSGREETLSGLPLVRQTTARTLFGAGQIYRVHQQTQKAKELFLRAAYIDPGHLGVRTLLAELLVRRGGPEEAAAVFEELAAEQPDNHLNFLFLGRLHDQRKDFAAAKRALRQAVDLAPDNPELYRELAEVYFRSGRGLEKTEALTEKLVELEPDYGPNYYLLGFARAKNGDLQGAAKAMEKAVELNPEKPLFQKFLRQLKAASKDGN